MICRCYPYTGQNTKNNRQNEEKGQMQSNSEQISAKMVKKMKFDNLQQYSSQH